MRLIIPLHVAHNSPSCGSKIPFAWLIIPLRVAQKSPSSREIKHRFRASRIPIRGRLPPPQPLHPAEPARGLGAEGFQQHALARIVGGGREALGVRAFVLDTPALPFAEGMVRPVPTVFLKDVHARSAERRIGSVVVMLPSGSCQTSVPFST